MNTQTLNISLPRELVRKVDELAKKEYSNRSELIRQALRVYTSRMDQEEWDRIFTSFRKAAKKAGITTKEQVNEMVREHRHGKKQ